MRDKRRTGSTGDEVGGASDDEEDAEGDGDPAAGADGVGGDPGAEPDDGSLGPFGGDEEAEQGDLEEEHLDQDEDDHREGGGGGRPVELRDLVEGDEVGGAGQGQEGAGDKGETDRSSSQHPFGEGLLWLLVGVLLLVASFAPFFGPRCPPRQQHPADYQQDRAEDEVLQRAQRRLTRFRSRAAAVEGEDDRQAHPHRREEGAEKEARNQALRVRQQHHHGHRRQQRRVEHREQRQQEDAEDVAHGEAFTHARRRRARDLVRYSYARKLASEPGSPLSI